MLALLFALLQIPSASLAFSNSSDDDGMLHCPKPESATSSCDAPTFFIYHICCGEADMFCCMRLQLHIIIGIAVLLLIALIATVMFFLHWIFRIKRNGRQSYNVS